jgi:hypothetical protein
MESHESNLLAAPVTDLARKGADAAQIADAMVSTLQKIDAALSPIIGKGGVGALYKRSLYLTGRAHSWMAGMHEGVETTMDLAALKALLVQQGSTDAAAGGGALLQAFHGVLTALVGSSLTERLLHSAWKRFFIPPNRTLRHDH